MDRTGARKSKRMGASGRGTILSSRRRGDPEPSPVDGGVRVATGEGARVSPAASGRRTGEHRTRLALVYHSREVEQAFQSLERNGELELDAVAASRVPDHGWNGRRGFDAVVVEQVRSGSKDGRDLIRRLRKSFPDTPLLTCGERPSSPRSPGVSLHLPAVPTVATLQASIADARRLHEASKKSSHLATRLRETSRRLQILSDIVSTANSILEPERVVAVIMSQIQKLIPSEAWSILLVDEERKELTFEKALGEKGEDLTEIRLKMGEGIAGWVAKTGKPAIVNDVTRDPRFQGRFDERTHFRTRSILCAPLVSRGRTIGVVEILNRATGSRFTKRDLNLLLTLVEPAAIALENAILFQKTERLAVTDDLTKLYNSRYLNSYLERELGRGREDDSPLSLIFLDLDGFKSVNDRHGHLCGSRTLLEVGSIIRRAVRDDDVISRYGGDEFVVVLPHTDSQGACAVAERIRYELKSHRFLSEQGFAVSLSASFGVSSFPEHASTPQDLIQKADQAMYSVKERGKDDVLVATRQT